MEKCTICGKDSKEMLNLEYMDGGLEPRKEHYCSCSCIMQSGHSNDAKLKMMKLLEGCETQKK